MRITLLGAGGGLGRLVREELAPHAVTAIPRAQARDPDAIAATTPEVIVNCAGASVAMGLGHGWRGYGAVDVPIGLAAARAARRTKARIVYVGVAHAPEQASCAYVAAHERVAHAMRDLDGCVVRLTGLFSAYASLVPMAKRGRLFDIGDGGRRTNPIHERDAARAVAGAITGADRELSIGGPEILTRRQIFEAVAASVGGAKISAAPVWLAAASGLAMRVLHPRMGQFVRFAVSLAKYDVVGRIAGGETLAAYLAQGSSKRTEIGV